MKEDHFDDYATVWSTVYSHKFKR